MTQDPTLFTAFEWVLLAMASLIMLVLCLLVPRGSPGTTIPAREELWLRDPASPAKDNGERL